MSAILKGETHSGQGIKWAADLVTARWLWMPLTLFITTRLTVAFVAYISVSLIPDSQETIYHLRPVENRVVDVFGSRWDTGFYISIAEEGYRYQDVDLPSVAFFPLLPIMMRALTPIVGDSLVAGLVISNVALLLAAILFYLLVEKGWGQSTADRATWYMLIFPAAFFGSAIYSESLFLLGTIGALYFARRGYWEVAALFGIATAMTRFIGLLVGPMLLVEWWVQRRNLDADRRPSTTALAAPLLVPLGTLAYMAYLESAFGDPLAFIHGAAAWARQPSSPLNIIINLVAAPTGNLGKALLNGTIHMDNWIDLLFVSLFLILGTYLLYRKRWSEGVFVLLGVVISMSSGLLMSQRRYMWVLFPAFIALALWGERPWVDRVINILSVALLALFTALFANGYWVG
jgi:Gpi18-like mannosyltransferase